MTYIVQRQDRFYVVDYDGLDPLTGRKRRRWHPVGHDRYEANALAARQDGERTSAPPKVGGPITLSEFLRETWLPQKRRQVRATTAYRYAWFVDRYIIPAIGDIPLRRLRVDHLDDLYAALATSGGRNGTGLAPKTVLEVHMIIRAALDAAGQRQLVERNVASAAHVRLSRASVRSAHAWTAQELAMFLIAARTQRLYPALHVAAHTGMRRGEVVGLKWSDLDVTNKRLSVQRTLQRVAGGHVARLHARRDRERSDHEIGGGVGDLLAEGRQRSRQALVLQAPDEHGHLGADGGRGHRCRGGDGLLQARRGGDGVPHHLGPGGDGLGAGDGRLPPSPAAQQPRAEDHGRRGQQRSGDPAGGHQHDGGEAG